MEKWVLLEKLKKTLLKFAEAAGLIEEIEVPRYEHYGKQEARRRLGDDREATQLFEEYL